MGGAGGAFVTSLLFCSGLIGAEARCPAPCYCKEGVVDCSGRGLATATLPSAFPGGTVELRLHDNHLTALPVGLLESLSGLRRVSLHGNPWSCDCGILYLRGWLAKQRNEGLLRNVSCSSPPALRGRLVVYLVEEDLLSTCRYWICDLALASQISLAIFVVVQALLLASVIFFLRRFNRLCKEARRTAEESFTGDHASGANEYVMLKDRNT
ncbi:platelet glycoprotein Ib beta chain [Denticeps clupeoides]|nr:platelet glycoprotein Ib beta chain-like [Denticeps clupeoides]XP_028820906.1 platelet glycoprotein Ib beta chain-like [Denticeps clupeoides]XP_028852271.1 platelet glycoprotein Ib beta chain-like [Denticeps clupeoides]XP_028852272.1 platelet glycoprotein Ib beta chain-like [Denticeps clupeoides]